MAENIFENLLNSNRPQALETISKAKKEREAFVKKLQGILSDSLSEVIEGLYRDFPATCEKVLIRIDTWRATYKPYELTTCSDDGFGIIFSVFFYGVKDYDVHDRFALLIPFEYFKSSKVAFGIKDLAGGIDKSSYLDSHNHSISSKQTDLYFFVEDHKEFQLISLAELFGGEVKTRFEIDFTEEASNNTAADNISEN